MLHMLRFISIRFVTALVTLFMVSFIVFGLMELVPGNCAQRYVAYKSTQGGGTITQADIDAEEKRMGLDRPFVVRWINWSYDIVAKGYLGESCLKRVSVNQILKDKIWISFGICFAALFIAYLIAVPLGMLSSTIRNSSMDSSLRFISYLGLALPDFLVALIVLMPPLGLFAVALQIWSSVAEELIDSPVLKALLVGGPLPGYYVCAAFLYGVGVLLGAAIFID